MCVYIVFFSLQFYFGFMDKYTVRKLDSEVRTVSSLEVVLIFSTLSRTIDYS